MAEEDTHDVQYEEYQESWTGRIVIAAVVALALIAGAFFAGKAMAGGGGPATLAQAVEQAQAGDLPCGESATPAASPAATPGANGGPPAGGGGAFLRGICDRSQGQGQNGQPGNAQGGGRFGGFGQTGQVTAITGDSLTLQGPTGDTTVKLDSSTTINKSAKGAVADIKAGDSVLVSGAGRNSQNAATSVTILPQADGS
jgi:hypothetical protein